MSDVYSVFRQMEDFSASPKSSPISKVIINVDSENSFVSGDDTGTSVEFYCPWGSQEMADNVLAQMQGFEYQPYTASRAVCPSIADVGDWVSANGIYSIIASRDIEYDGGLNPMTLSAPKEEELESEYPYVPPEDRKASRELARTRSLITKTADEIRLEVQGLDDKYTALSVTIDGVTVTDSSGTTMIKGSSIETDTLYVNAANITGKLTANQIDATDLNVSAANITGTLTIGQLPSNVATDSDIPLYTSELINNSGYQTESGVTTIINGTVTTDYVNALNIYAATLRGNQIQLLQSSGSQSGIISLTSASSGSYAVDITSNSALRLTASSGSLYLQNSRGFAYLDTSYAAWVTNNCYPSGDNEWNSGRYDRRWMNVYAATGTIQTSDKKQKNSIESLGQKYFDLAKDLTPKRYKFNDGTSGRYHVGFVAQEVKEAMDAHGLDSLDFAGWCMDETENGEICSLRYDEVLTLKIADIESRLKELEAKS